VCKLEGERIIPGAEKYSHKQIHGLRPAESLQDAFLGTSRRSEAFHLWPILVWAGTGVQQILEGLKVLPLDRGLDRRLHQVIAWNERWTHCAHDRRALLC
jgi:hypothetical protein